MMPRAKPPKTALVADIGATNARFALAELGASPKIGGVRAYRAEDFASLAEAAHTYLNDVPAKPAVACFAVAGPITDDIVEFTNSPWKLDISATRRQLGIDRLVAVNDFEALAAGVRLLAPADFFSVKKGAGAVDAPVLLIGPGTGLGQALIVPGRGAARIVPTEGGHVGFAPHTEEEIELLRFLSNLYGRVSIERLLSGPGLLNIHRALAASSDSPAYAQADDLTRAAVEGRDPAAARTLGLFFAILGGAVGDALLATGARGGVVLGGGILPRNRDMLMKSAFLDRFLNKGRMRGYVEAAPIDLIVREGAALVGAAALLAQGR